MNDFSPRSSALKTREASPMSTSVVSTPTHRRAKPQKERPKVDDKDWAGMEPDEVFRRLPVLEVKKVEAKMRGDAMNKQSELRSMVG